MTGKKIKITLNAWPHLAEYSEQIIAYYWVDFEIHFKTNFKLPDIKGLLPELKERIIAFYITGGGGREIAEILVENEIMLEHYMKISPDNCQKTMLQFFSEPGGTNSKIQWRATLFEDDYRNVMWLMDEIIDEEWHGFHTWFEGDFHEQPFEPIDFHLWEFDRDKAFEQSIEENIAELKSLILTIKNEARVGNTATIKEKEKLINEYLNVLSEKANREEFEFTVSELESLMESLFAEHTKDLKKEQIKSTNFSETLHKVSEKRIDSHCKGKDKWCGEGYSCLNSECISAKGGNETCDNGIDDDSDNIVDCDDPDCFEFKECGRVCESICNIKNGCWQCHSENCDRQCNACGECNKKNPKGDERCHAPCNSCGTCVDTYCGSKCDSCWSCENEQYGDGCYDTCKECDSCNKQEGKDCGETCKPCNVCRFEAGDWQCHGGQQFSYETGNCECEEKECGQGQHFDWGECICREGCFLDCPKGFVPNYENCECIEDWICNMDCPEGYKLDEEECRCVEARGDCDLSCPEGQEISEHECVCVEIPDYCAKDCQEGYELNWDECVCVKIEICDLECPKGFDLDSINCVCNEILPQCTLECPQGQELMEDKCVCVEIPCEISCPTGQHLDEDACVCREDVVCDKECLEGQELNIGDCECVEIQGNLKSPQNSFGIILFSPLFPSFASGLVGLEEELVEEETEEQSIPEIVIEGETIEGENTGEEIIEVDEEGVGEVNENNEEIIVIKEENKWEEEKEHDEFEEFRSCEDIKCSSNQYCDPKTGWCECQKGFWECDGDWQNGCESENQCKPCQSDSDCALSRCSDDRFSVVNFVCEQGKEWEETIAEFEFRGNCEKKTSGDSWGHINFNGWGEKFDEINKYKDQFRYKFESNWCQEELALKIRERLELQKSFNQDFLNWFFREFVSENPNEFMFHEESLKFVYEAFQRNTEDTARNLRCLNRSDWPSEFVPVSLSTQTPNGKIRFWEELKSTDYFGERQQIMSPYMEAWFFPSKEQFKKLMVEEFKKEGSQGPNAIEIEEMRKNPEVMGKINNISNIFGGEARILLAVNDGDQTVLRMFLEISPETIMRMSFPEQNPENIDATISLSFDFFYDTMSTIIKDLEGSHTVRPHWEERDFRPPEIDGALVGLGLFSKIILAIPTGQVQVEPITAIPGVLLAMMDLMSFMQMR